jgi:hypothetical protein
MAYRNVLPVVALLAWVIVNVSLATVEMYIVPLPTSVAAFAVVGVSITVEPGAIMPDCVGVTTVVAAPVVSVTVPTAFDRPAASC